MNTRREMVCLQASQEQVGTISTMVCRGILTTHVQRSPPHSKHSHSSCQLLNRSTPTRKLGAEHVTHVHELHSTAHADYLAVLALPWTVSDVAVDRSLVLLQSLVCNN